MTLKDFKLKLLKSNGIRLYRVEGYQLLVQESNTLVGEFYELSTKEVLNVVNYFKLLPKLRKIVINNKRNLHLGGYVNTASDIMELHIAGDWLEKRTGYKTDRQNTLFVLLHEIGHLRGIKDEPGADKFAKDHMDKFWGSMIKE